MEKALETVGDEKAFQKAYEIALEYLQRSRQEIKRKDIKSSYFKIDETFQPTDLELKILTEPFAFCFEEFEEESDEL